VFNKKKAEEEAAPSGTSQEYSPNTPSRVKPMTASANPASAATTPYPKEKSPFPLGTETEPEKETDKGSRLHVGKDIHLKGEITACDRLIVEGKVEASMNSNEIEITESGMFSGEVIIDTADISGEFEGTLTARTKLIIRKTGRVSGDIKYGEIEIEPGGEVSGNLEKSLDHKKDLSLGKKIVAKKVKEQANGPTAHH